ncbi:MAG: uroporphyrinogen decarboxylase family protein [Bacillota bacterium]|nr:uroporphyrinogen decarboxylase family protein [Bacillota bacterium]
MKTMVIPKDDMTPIERSQAIKTGRSYDRIPCSPMVAEQVIWTTSITVKDYLFNPKMAAEAQAKAFDYFGYDSVSVSPDHHGFAEAMGCKFVYTAYERPQIKEYCIKNLQDIEKLEPVDPKKTGRLKLCLEAVARLQDLVGDKVKVGSGMGGPMTCASFMRGPDHLLRDMRKNPEAVHKIMEVNTQNLINYMAACWEYGVGCSVGDSFASCTMISPRDFRTFVKPYLKRIADWQIEHIGAAGNLHICGDSHPLWDDMAELGFSSVSLDNAMDLAGAKMVMGNKVALKGNVKPVETMLYGTAEEVLQASRECIEKCIDNPRGYTLSSGCTLPVNTPIENVEAMVNAARLWGRPKS